MNIRLLRLSGENFKGLREFEGVFDGEDAIITAANGVGKTTVYDAFLWLLFNKDSTGRKDFELRPLDEQNQVRKGLVLAVTAEIGVDGVTHVLRKEHREKVVKKQLRGYETLCWVDEVPKKVGEYADYVTEIIPEDTFKMLTNLKHFSEGLHWKSRRAVLLEITGAIARPEGFDKLLAALNGRTIDEYKKVLAEQKKRYEKDRDEINPRIDEIQRGLEAYVGGEAAQLQQAREALRDEIVSLDGQRQTLLEQEKERQAAIGHLNDLKAKQMKRQGELETDTSGIAHLLEEKAKLETGVAQRCQSLTECQNARQLKAVQITGKESELAEHMQTLKPLRAEYDQANAASVDATCYACGQPLPTDKLAENEQRRQDALAEITKRGNETKARVDACKADIEELRNKLRDLDEACNKAEIELHDVQEYQSDHGKKLQERIDAHEPIPPEQDKAWKDIALAIKEVTAAIGESVPEKLTQIEGARKLKADRLESVNAALAQVDRMKKDAARIEELEAEERKLAQSIANVEQELVDIDKYKATESRMIEAAVNGKFKHVKFKLFTELLNGSLEECCEATLNGVPYADMSTGQQILGGIDINNVLSAHYGMSVPLFIDHAESFTLPIEANCQVVELYAKNNVNTLEIKTKGELAHV